MPGINGFLPALLRWKKPNYADLRRFSHVRSGAAGMARKDSACQFDIGQSILCGWDPLPEQYQPPKGFQVLIDVQDVAEAERIFRALSECGTMQMPLQKTFWSIRFGVLVDRFGISWEVNCQHAPE
jgi:PhnB protein